LFPGQVATWYQKGFLKVGDVTSTGYWISDKVIYLFSPGSWFASICYAALVMGFTYFYTAVIFDVRDLADNLKKYGGQIQGYAPGRPTQLYIDKVLTRITFAGGLFLAGIALLQWWVPTILGLVRSSGAATLVGGTSILIVVGVALEIMQNLDQQLKMRQYEGLVRQMGNKR
jgi:preprotein translocase subunit SecY